jgi:aerobic carbon-monoxide dehydrogenase small subunit
MNRISLNVNGRPVSSDVEPRTHLADFLRESRDLTGTHLGCEHGVCGACTLLVDGVPVRSCITFAVTCDGASVVTIEGLDDDDIMHELRDAFRREHALQCGYCTPGMLISARDLVARSVAPDEREIRIAMSGNLCRCTGYVGIIRAIKSVIVDRQTRRVSPVPAAKHLALGPAGSGHASTEVANVTARRAAPAPQPRAAPTRKSKPPMDRSWTPQVSFDQSFLVSYPRQQVWDLFGRVQDVASCLPGASLIGEPTPEHVEGQIRIKVGPIAAEFRGEAAIERDESAYSGRIIGAGSDARSSSATRGMISYRLLPAGDGQSTEVAMTIGYTLTGMLAQVGRAGVVQDVAARMTSAFVRNLEARLGGKAVADSSAGGLDAGSLLFSVLVGRVKELLGRVFRACRS